MEQALSAAAVDHLSCCTELLDQTETICRPERMVRHTGQYKRHLDEQGRLVHLVRDGCGMDTCVAEEWMDVYNGDFLYVEIYAEEKFIMKEGLYPILAGYTPNGQPTYCAHLWYRTRNGRKFSRSYVIEGMTLADALAHHHVEDAIALEEACIQMPVLCYAPETYPPRSGPADFISGKDDGKDATGPYSWRPAGRLVYEGDGDEAHQLLVDPISGQIIKRDRRFAY